MFKNGIIVGYTKDNQAVYSRSDTLDNHIHNDFNNEETVRNILSGIIAGEEPFMRLTLDMGAPVGKTALVETTDDDEVFYARRKGREGLSRMVIREKDETNLATIILCRDTDHDGRPTIVSAFPGKPGEREPWDVSLKTAEAKENAEAFWANHALAITEDDFCDIEIETEESARMILRFLVDQMNLDFHEHTEVFYASDSDIIDSWEKEVYYPDGSHRLDPINTIEQIRELIDWHIDGYSRNPDGYDY